VRYCNALLPSTEKLILLLFLLGRRSSKKALGSDVSLFNRIGMKFGRIVLRVNMYRVD